jgi:hypothetical protein
MPILRPEVKAAALAMQKRMEENTDRDKLPPLTADEYMSEAARNLITTSEYNDRPEYQRRQLADCMVYCALALAKLPTPDRGGQR